jgi:hypothetical protein
MNLIKLDFDEWETTFKPMKNPLVDNPDTRPPDGYRFETYGQEDDYVRAFAEVAPLHVWTMLDGEEDLVITDGWHFVNRFAYFITDLPADPDTHYEIDY